MIKYQKAAFLTIIAVLMLATGAKAQATDYNYHTIFVYNFTKYIQWPDASSEVVIGIQGGNAAVMGAFEKMAHIKSTPDRKFTIRAISSPEDAANCHVIFIPNRESSSLVSFSQKYEGTPKLIVTEREGLTRRGGLINFVIMDGKLRFELNQEAIEKAGLKVSSQLLGLAILV